MKKLILLTAAAALLAIFLGCTTTGPAPDFDQTDEARRILNDPALRTPNRAMR